MPTVPRGRERRRAPRHARVVRARAAWRDDHEVLITIENFSASGCYFSALTIPPHGEQVRLRVEGPHHGGHLAILGNTVRCTSTPEKRAAAVAFIAPCPTLLEHAPAHEKRCAVLVVDADERARDAIVLALSRLGAWALGVASADDALRNAERFDLGAVLARADYQGAHALELIGARATPPLRIAFGADAHVAFAVAHGLADVAIDNPCDAAMLKSALRRRSP
jgi:hypothetical protein